jgi:hypothetical protein
VNLNTRRQQVLEAILSGAGQLEGQANPALDHGKVATDLRTHTSTQPLVNRSELVLSDWAYAASDPDAHNAFYPAVKTRREAVVRALAEATTTRTWNLMIDVVAQTGRYTSTAQTLDEFTVEGETRYWWHVAVDRVTGQIIDQQWERVME